MLCRYAECHTECRVLSIIMLSVFMLNVVMLNVIILSVERLKTLPYYEHS
jgi:hypothetical protein